MPKIDKATALCVVPREEEWTKLETQIAAQGWDYERFLAGSLADTMSHHIDYFDVGNPDVSEWGYGGIGRKHHHWNAYQCHKQMIIRAKKEGRKNLLILEDDAYITDRFDSVWNPLSAAIDERSLPWDIIYMGWWIGDEGDEFNEKVEADFAKSGIIRLDRTKRVGGLHGALINAHVFDFLLSLPPYNPIDCQLNYYHHEMNNFCVMPKIIHTKTMFSICEGSVMKRNEL